MLNCVATIIGITKFGIKSDVNSLSFATINYDFMFAVFIFLESNFSTNMDYCGKKYSDTKLSPVPGIYSLQKDIDFCKDIELANSFYLP
jgi:hypothetical protein